jgi:hypothetical protein
MKGRSGIISSTRQLLMDIGTPGDYNFDVYGMYSMRYLNRAYKGPIFNAYKDSNGATQDIYPDDLYDGTLTTFGGGGKVRVKTLYDQSGNSNDASQTSRFNMPEIINSSGTLQTCCGLPAMDFDGGNDFIPLNSALPNIDTGNCSSFVVGEYDGTTLNPAELMLSLGATTASARWYSPMGYQNEYIFGYNSTWNEQVIAGSDTDPHLFSAIVGTDQGDWRCFIDGAQQGTATRASRASGGTYGIGGLNSVSQYALDGRVNEVLVFDGDCSTLRAAIEKNIMDYYGID